VACGSGESLTLMTEVLHSGRLGIYSCCIGYRLQSRLMRCLHATGALHMLQLYVTCSAGRTAVHSCIRLQECARSHGSQFGLAPWSLMAAAGPECSQPVTGAHALTAGPAALYFFSWPPTTAPWVPNRRCLALGWRRATHKQHTVDGVWSAQRSPGDIGAVREQMASGQGKQAVPAHTVGAGPPGGYVFSTTRLARPQCSIQRVLLCTLVCHNQQQSTE
jgi:hypothetical protein